MACQDRGSGRRGGTPIARPACRGRGQYSDGVDTAVRASAISCRAVRSASTRLSINVWRPLLSVLRSAADSHLSNSDVNSRSAASNSALSMAVTIARSVADLIEGEVHQGRPKVGQAGGASPTLRGRVTETEDAAFTRL